MSQINSSGDEQSDTKRSILCFVPDRTGLEQSGDMFSLDGLPIPKMIVKRTKKVEELMEGVMNYSTVLVISPPFTGKTCLLQLFCEYYPTCVVRISLSGRSRITNYNELVEHFNNSLSYSDSFVYKSLTVRKIN